MKTLFVLDTDACVDLLRSPAKVLPQVRPLQDEAPIATTAVTVQELHEGAHRSRDAGRELRRVDRLLSAMDVLPHERATAEIAGRTAAALLAEGKPVGDLDTIIAAITLHHGATLVTRNVRHFQRIPGLNVHAL